MHSLYDEMTRKEPDDLWLNDCGLEANLDGLIDAEKDKDLFDYLTSQAESVSQEKEGEEDVDVTVDHSNNEEPDLTKLYSQLAPEKNTPQSTARTIRVVRVAPAKPVKAPSVAESDDVTDKNRKNAIQARINRQKKKQYIQGLESKVDELTSENEQLQKNSVNLQKDKASLEEEVAYLKSVIANQSTLSSLLQNISNVDNIQLSSSFSLSRKRSTEQDHDYIKPSKKSKTTNSRDMGLAGVCLHVDKNNVSLEFCSKCSHMSKGGRPAKKR